ncbi:hypothetical protein MMC16_005767 [Acarospora aff. strigata]|nr:hypothetical protein [Acarospora aff. strigata]
MTAAPKTTPTTTTSTVQPLTSISAIPPPVPPTKGATLRVAVAVAVAVDFDVAVVPVVVSDAVAVLPVPANAAVATASEEPAVKSAVVESSSAELVSETAAGFAVPVPVSVGVEEAPGLVGAGPGTVAPAEAEGATVGGGGVERATTVGPVRVYVEVVVNQRMPWFEKDQE